LLLPTLIYSIPLSLYIHLWASSIFHFSVFHSLIDYCLFITSIVQKQSHSIAKVNLEKENWNIIARVLRLWFIQDYTKSKYPFSMKIVLNNKEVMQYKSFTNILLFNTIITYNLIYKIFNAVS